MGKLGLPPVLPEESLEELEDDAHAGQVLIGIAGIAQGGVEDSRCRREVRAGKMMVGDDDFDADFLDVPDKIVGFDAAIDADDQSSPLLANHVHVLGLEAIPVFQAGGDEIGLDRDGLAKCLDRIVQFAFGSK